MCEVKTTKTNQKSKGIFFQYTVVIPERWIISPNESVYLRQIDEQARALVESRASLSNQSERAI